MHLFLAMCFSMRLSKRNHYIASVQMVLALVFCKYLPVSYPNTGVSRSKLGSSDGGKDMMLNFVVRFEKIVF